MFGALLVVNLVNFMDGVDWMTVAEIVPLPGASRSSADLGSASARGDIGCRRSMRGYDGFAPLRRANRSTYSR